MERCGREYRLTLGPDRQPRLLDPKRQYLSELPELSENDDPAQMEAARAEWDLFNLQVREVMQIQTARLQNAPSNPNAAPATKPATTRSLFSCFGESRFKPAIPSTVMAPPRETISEIMPHANAPATAEDTATRHAMFDIGSNAVKSQA